jgi:hypothetical protein
MFIYWTHLFIKIYFDYHKDGRNNRQACSFVKMDEMLTEQELRDTSC